MRKKRVRLRRLLSSIEDIPDTQLEYYCVKIPALMYRAGVKLEEFGLMADISSSQKRQEYNEAMLKVCDRTDRGMV